jgi:hypothetical protein
VRHEKPCRNRPPPGENARRWATKAAPLSGRQTFFTLKNVGDIKTNNSGSLFQRSQSKLNQRPNRHSIDDLRQAYGIRVDVNHGNTQV